MHVYVSIRVNARACTGAWAYGAHGVCRMYLVVVSCDLLRPYYLIISILSLTHVKKISHITRKNVMYAVEF